MNRTRRHLIATLSLAALSATSAALAQPAPPLVGVLFHGSENALQGNLAAFRTGMTALGHIEGKTYRLDTRASGGVPTRLPDLAAGLVRAEPAVILAANTLAAQEAWRTTKTVPIVLASGVGLLEAGMIAGLSKPGGNVTGILSRVDELTEKLFELLREIAPDARNVLALASGQGLVEPEVRRAGRHAGEALGMTITDVTASTPEELAALPDLCRRLGCQGMVQLPDPTLAAFMVDMIRAVEVMRVPAIYSTSAIISAGGLASFTPPPGPAWRRSANYVDRILKGASPGDLPVQRMDVFELTINLRTAKAIGLTVPQSVLLRADEVIE